LIDENHGLLGEQRNDPWKRLCINQHVNVVASRQKTGTWLVFYSYDGSVVSPRILSRWSSCIQPRNQ
jgi:hypothetical protein